MEENTPAVVETEVQTQVETQENGQGIEAVAETAPQEDFETQLNGFYEKKGWSPETGVKQLFESYQQLESKLGNWKEVEERASRYDEFSQKAQMWDRAQQHLEQLRLSGQLEQGQIDYAHVPVNTLSELWKSGQLNIADLPPEKQYEVQRYTHAQDMAFEQATQTQARNLAEKYPILKDPVWAETIATQIEQGVYENGRELEPEEIVLRYDRVLKDAEKRGEEKLKAQTEELKLGNLERTSSAAMTKPNIKVKTVHDAFMAAKRELGG
jgi:hypothetical protein